MEEEQTWRELLGTLISDPQERQRLAEALGVNPITLIRWTTGKSNPRQDNLRPLLDALPSYRQQFVERIAKEFPHFFVHNVHAEQQAQEIPSAFYARVLNANASGPQQLRAASVRLLILQQMLGQLDPQQQGLIVVTGQCLTPTAGHMVRSLRTILGRGTGIFATFNESYTQLCGIESQIGQAVTKGHPVIVQSHEEKAQRYPTHYVAECESIVAYPILLGDRIAGSLCVISALPNYFTQTRLDLIQSYTELMVLAFDPNEFYDLRAIDLGIMPTQEIQQPIIARFPQRLTRLLIQAAQNQQHRTHSEAEMQVWQEIEEELLRRSFMSDQE